MKEHGCSMITFILSQREKFFVTENDSWVLQNLKTQNAKERKCFIILNTRVCKLIWLDVWRLQMETMIDFLLKIRKQWQGTQRVLYQHISQQLLMTGWLVDEKLKISHETNSLSYVIWWEVLCEGKQNQNFTIRRTLWKWHFGDCPLTSSRCCSLAATIYERQIQTCRVSWAFYVAKWFSIIY